jgi:hypothetical protein
VACYVVRPHFAIADALLGRLAPRAADGSLRIPWTHILGTCWTHEDLRRLAHWFVTGAARIEPAEAEAGVRALFLRQLLRTDLVLQGLGLDRSLQDAADYLQGLAEAMRGAPAAPAHAPGHRARAAGRLRGDEVQRPRRGRPPKDAGQSKQIAEYCARHAERFSYKQLKRAFPKIKSIYAVVGRARRMYPEMIRAFIDADGDAEFGRPVD